MKALLTTLTVLFSISLYDSKPASPEKTDGLLISPPVVYVFDYNGNLINSFSKQDIKCEEISILDLELLETSQFAFDYNGNEYRFKS